MKCSWQSVSSYWLEKSVIITCNNSVFYVLSTCYCKVGNWITHTYEWGVILIQTTLQVKWDTCTMYMWFVPWFVGAGHICVHVMILLTVTQYPIALLLYPYYEEVAVLFLHGSCTVNYAGSPTKVPFILQLHLCLIRWAADLELPTTGLRYCSEVDFILTEHAVWRGELLKVINSDCGCKVWTELD